MFPKQVSWQIIHILKKVIKKGNVLRKSHTNTIENGKIKRKMKSANHLFEDGIYLISNHAVAKNPMFATEKMQKYFLNSMKQHLASICKIMAYNLNGHEFQILVKLESREVFENYYMNRKNSSAITTIPDTTYLFSQAMANLQVSFVKHFNFVFKRSGTLMAGRYKRRLIESQYELEDLVQKLNSGLHSFKYSKKWANEMIVSKEIYTSDWLYNRGITAISQDSPLFQKLTDFNLVGYFQNLPPLRLESTKHYFTQQFNRLFGPKPANYF